MLGKKKKGAAGIDEDELPVAPKSGKGKAMVLGAALVLVGGTGQRFLLAGSPAEVIIAPPASADGKVTTTSATKIDCSQFESAAAAAPHGRRASGEAGTGGTSDLPSMTINLADGKFLKIGLSLELGPQVVTETFKAQQAKAADVALRYFATKTAPQLTNDKHEAIKAELTCKMQAAYAGSHGSEGSTEPTITGVLFREFLTS